MGEACEGNSGIAPVKLGISSLSKGLVVEQQIMKTKRQGLLSRQRRSNHDDKARNLSGLRRYSFSLYSDIRTAATLSSPSKQENRGPVIRVYQIHTYTATLSLPIPETLPRSIHAFESSWLVLKNLYHTSPEAEAQVDVVLYWSSCWSISFYQLHMTTHEISTPGDSNPARKNFSTFPPREYWNREMASLL